VLALVLLTVGRRRLGIGYEAWRCTHALLAVLALALAWAHVALMGPYVGTPGKRLALGLYCAAFASLIVHLRLVKPALLRRRPYAVVEVRPDAARTWALAVRPLGHEGLRFAPGQFAWIKVGVSPWSLREHPFSFSSSAEDPRRLEFGIKELGDFTSTIGRVPAGAPVYVDGPHGSFSTDFLRSGGFLFVAGGIGISPILSMLRTLADRGDRRPHVLVYACSRWDRVAFRDEVRALAGRLDLDVIFVLEHAHEGWTGGTGYVSQALLRRVLSRDAVQRDVLLCGPDPMLAAVESGLLECGVPPERIHLERFDLA
jgi:predicted ferric reductase